MPKTKNLDALLRIRSTATSLADLDDLYIEVAEVVLEIETTEKLESVALQEASESVHSLRKQHFAYRQKERDE